MGDPAKPFFVDARQFPAGRPWPSSLRTRYEERESGPLADYIDGLLYLGPDRDRDVTGSIPLSEAQKRELDRRNSLRSDPQRAMRARLQGREQWFRGHPNDVPPRPYAATIASGNFPARSFLWLVNDAMATQRFRIGAVALALHEWPLDVMLRDEFIDRIPDAVRHRHRFDNVFTSREI
jgi:hypothetical protein